MHAVRFHCAARVLIYVHVLQWYYFQFKMQNKLNGVKECTYIRNG